jgi:hypothetical protein
MLKHKQRQSLKLQEKWGSPEPPWKSVSPNVIWNIHNTPASQISMLAHVRGLSFAPIGACATFGVCLKLGMDAIRRGEAKAVIIGATEPVPHPVIIGGMFRPACSRPIPQSPCPFTGPGYPHRGGACVWIIDWDYKLPGIHPARHGPLAVGTSNTPTTSIRRRWRSADRRCAGAGSPVAPGDLVSWDSPRSSPPGDYPRSRVCAKWCLPQLVTARRNLQAGMGAGAAGAYGAVGAARGMVSRRRWPSHIHPAIRGLHTLFAFDQACRVEPGPMGKLSMGVGGVNACVISRPLKGA